MVRQSKKNFRANKMASVEIIYQNEDYHNDRETEQQVDDESLIEDSSRSSSTSSPAPSDDQQQEQIYMLDPSEHFRPEGHSHGKAIEAFRKYSDDEEDYIQKRVKYTYYQMHKNQTVDFVSERMAMWSKFDRAELTIMEALIKLNNLIDESDPDSDLPNIVHAFQTAERIRAAYPDQDWFHLTGLIHDLGKVLAFWGEEQWAVVGDTFVVGCAFENSIVYRENSFNENPDFHDSRYNTKYGIYKPNCGLKNVMFSSSHDGYLYHVLKNHKQCKLPEAGLMVILLHSFYPWHTGGDYMHLCDESDMKVLPLIREFNKFDLYTKSAPVPDIEKLMPYYQGLIDKYIPGKIRW